jgi:dTDP-4-dehydrorhamnose 3,5-epimerase
MDWPDVGKPIVSERDLTLPMLVDFDTPFDYDGVPMKMVGVE